MSNARPAARLRPGQKLGNHVAWLVASDPIPLAKCWIAAKALKALSHADHDPGSLVAKAQLTSEMTTLLAAAMAELADQITAEEITSALAALAGKPGHPAFDSARVLCELADQLEAGKIPFTVKMPDPE